MSALHGRPSDHIVIRMADEGIPLAAISRVVQRDIESIVVRLLQAIDEKEIPVMPPDDWPDDSRRDMRLPETFTFALTDIAELSVECQRAFNLSPSRARLLAVLLQRRKASRPLLHAAVCRKATAIAKTIDIQACHLRKRLKEFDITFESIWGHGYCISDAMAERALDILRARRRIAPPIAPDDMRARDHV